MSQINDQTTINAWLRHYGKKPFSDSDAAKLVARIGIVQLESLESLTKDIRDAQCLHVLRTGHRVTRGRQLEWVKKVSAATNVLIEMLDAEGEHKDALLSLGFSEFAQHPFGKMGFFEMLEDLKIEIETRLQSEEDEIAKMLAQLCPDTSPYVPATELQETMRTHLLPIFEKHFGTPTISREVGGKEGSSFVLFALELCNEYGLHSKPIGVESIIAAVTQARKSK